MESFERPEDGLRVRLLPIAVVALLLFALMTLVLLAVKGKGAESESAEVVFEVNEVAEIEPFCFDPNSVTYEQLLELGVPKRTAVSLLKYRAAGGVFSIPEEVALCYGVSDSLYQALKPYIVIAPEFRVELANLKPMESTRDTVIRYEPFRVDTVGVAYLRTIGFSHRRAVAFLNYRDSRGGLRNIEEVRDCYVIPSVECDTLSRYMIFPEQTVRKEPLRVPIELNRSSLEELTKVVGIDERVALRIIDYRRKLGGFVRKEQLQEIKMAKECDFLQIFEQIYCDSCNISKIDINFARSQRIGVHPYISDLALRKIIKTRELKGGWSTIEEMIDDDIFTRDEAERLRPYLRFAFTE